MNVNSSELETDGYPEVNKHPSYRNELRSAVRELFLPTVALYTDISIHPAILSQLPIDDSEKQHIIDFRHSTAELIAAQLVSKQILADLTHPQTSVGRSVIPEDVTRVQKFLDDHAVNMTEFDERATFPLEHLLFRSEGMEAGQKMKKRDRFEGEVSRLFFDAFMLMAERNIQEHSIQANKHPNVDDSARTAQTILLKISSECLSAVRHGEKGRVNVGAQIKELATFLEPIVFQPAETSVPAVEVWLNSPLPQAVKEAFQFTFQGESPATFIQQCFEKGLEDPKKNNQLLPDAERVIQQLDNKRWDKLNVHGKAAAVSLLLYSDAPIMQKVQMVLDNPLLAKTWTHIENNGSEAMRRSLATWREANILAYTVYQSADTAATSRLGFVGKAQRAMDHAKTPTLPAVTNLEDIGRKTKIAAGIGLGALVVSACAGVNHPTATPGHTPDTHPTAPQLVDLLASYNTLVTALNTTHITSIQCSFPQGDIAGHAAYIDALNVQLKTTDTAMQLIPSATDLSKYTLICDKQTTQVYFQSEDGKILIATQTGLMPGIIENGVVTMIQPPSPTQENPTATPGVFSNPEYVPLAGGAPPSFLTDKDPKTGISEWDGEVASQQAALKNKGIDPSTVNILFMAWPNSALDQHQVPQYRWGSVLELKNKPNTIYWAQYDDGAKEFAIRPDMRPASRPWHYQEVTIPAWFGSSVSLVPYFPIWAEQPMVYLADSNTNNGLGQPKVIGVFNPALGKFIDLNGSVLVPPTAIPSPTPEASPTPALPSVPELTALSIGNFNVDTDFHPVDQQGLNALGRYILAHPKLSIDDSVTPLSLINKASSSGSKGIDIVCNLRKNIIFWFAISMTMKSGRTADFIVYEGVVKGTDGHNHTDVLVVNANPGFPDAEDIEQDVIRSLANASSFYLIINTEITNPTQYPNPIRVDVAAMGGQPAKDLFDKQQFDIPAPGADITPLSGGIG